MSPKEWAAVPAPVSGIEEAAEAVASLITDATLSSRALLFWFDRS